MYSNGEVIFSLIIEFASSRIPYTFCLQIKIQTYNIALPLDYIIGFLRIEGVPDLSDAEIATHEFFDKSSSDKSKILSPNSQWEWYGASFGGTSNMENATYFNIHIVVPGTYIPMASINHILKSDYLNS